MKYHWLDILQAIISFKDGRKPLPLLRMKPLAYGKELSSCRQGPHQHLDPFSASHQPPLMWKPTTLKTPSKSTAQEQCRYYRPLQKSFISVFHLHSCRFLHLGSHATGPEEHILWCRVFPCPSWVCFTCAAIFPSTLCQGLMTRL